LGEYSLPPQVLGKVSREFEFDVSDMVTGNGMVSLKLRDLGRMGIAKIDHAEFKRQVRLMDGDWQPVNPIPGTMVLRPSVETDKFGNMIIAWYMKEDHDRIVFSTVDNQCQLKQSEITVFSSDEEIKDISICTNEWGEVNILWTSRSDEKNYLRHAVYDQGGSVIVDPYPVSNNQREWDKIDDLGGPMGLFFIIATPVAITASIITFGIFMWIKRARRKAAIDIVLDYTSLPHPEEEVIFEVISRK
jgi:hypothetical protein